MEKILVTAGIVALYFFLIHFKFVYPPQRQGFTGKGVALVFAVLAIYFLFIYKSPSPALTHAYGVTPGYA